MAQELKHVRARNLTEAYQKMRKQYGKTAVVLGTHTVADSGLWGFLGRKHVEITVSVQKAAPPPAAKPAPRRASAVERRYASQSQMKERKPEMNETVQYFEKLVREAQTRLGTAPPELGGATPKMSTPIQKSAARATPKKEAAANVVPSPVIPFPRQQVEEGGNDTEELHKEMRDIREMIQVMYAENPGAGLPTEFAPHYRTLVNRGVSRKVAAALISSVVRGSDLGILRDPRIFSERLHVELRKAVPVTGAVRTEPDRCRVIALCGATGVGKTTNVAKLAAHFSVHELAKVGLITTDTYRVGAAEQLRVYANIIGVPLRVANDSKELQDGLNEFRDCELVLVDTAGSSQFNLEQIGDLKGMLQVARPDETFLVMSAGTPLDDLRNVAANFKCLDPTALLFTKLDETRQYGALFSMLMESALPVSYVSVGQNVPDDIRVASPGMVANLILGGTERHG